MILVADGGSTSVDWCLIDNGIIEKRITTKGANPFFRTTEDISAELKTSLVPEMNGSKIQAVHFYGAGCAYPEVNKVVKEAILQNFDVNQEDVEVDSDMLGAAVGLYGNQPGIACILGTGANSCFYDGEKIVKNVSPLGYILGDEGSGAVLGRLFLGSCLKYQFGEKMRDDLLNYLQMDIPEIINRVYKQALPNRFLASIAPFINANIQHEGVRKLVFDAFTDFFKKNIMQYDDYQNYQVSFIGSVAYYFEDVLKEAASSLNIQIGAIVISPMEGIVKHFAKR